jgi:hypothetical protein
MAGSLRYDHDWSINLGILLGFRLRRSSYGAVVRDAFGIRGLRG